jgi:hypothetical protein
LHYKKYREDFPERKSASDARNYSKNSEKIKANVKKWYKENRDWALERQLAYNRLNAGATNARISFRKAWKIRATPAWANRFAIKTIYSKCQRLTAWTQELYNVDHIVPLKSKFVCGLHCEANLRIIPKLENLVKSNLHWPDMWEPLKE